MTPVVLQVPAGQARAPVHIQASLAGLGDALAQTLPPGPCVVICPPPVAELHLAAAITSLRGAGFAPEVLLVPDGEPSKTPETWLRLLTDLAVLGAERSTPLIALGGGVTGDLVGFAAACWQRGVPVVQVPTTLLAMVDASVGGKTAVDLSLPGGLHGRNLVGAFHHPRVVFIAVDVLRTLPPIELRAGMAEVIKHAVLADAALFHELTERGPALLAPPLDGLGSVIRRCVQIKAHFVGLDERDQGHRAALNFGHTVGHAIEAAAQGQLRHGLCVSMGMVAECRYGVDQGWSPPHLPDQIAQLLRTFDLPVAAPTLPLDTLQAALLTDKKRAHGTVRVVAIESLGTCSVVSVDVSRVFEMLSYLLSSAE